MSLFRSIYFFGVNFSWMLLVTGHMKGKLWSISQVNISFVSSAFPVRNVAIKLKLVAISKVRHSMVSLYQACFPLLNYAWTWLWKCSFSLVLSFYHMTSLWFTTFVYTTFYYDTLKPKGGTNAFSICSFFGHFFSSFDALGFKIFETSRKCWHWTNGRVA